MNLIDTPVMAICGRPRKGDGLPCENPVRRDGMACRLHGGPGALTSGKRRSTRTYTSPSAQRRRTARQNPAQRRVPVVPAPAYRETSPRKPATATPRQQPPRPSPPSRSEQERKRVEKAAQLCAAVVSSGWREAVADQVMAYAPTTWGRLRRSDRRRNCKALARMARFILKTKALIHKGVGKLFGWVADRFGADDAVRSFAEELASNIPLPIDAKMIAVARGLQVTGILLCVMDDKDLEQCDCFIDLVRAETEERVKQILIAGMSDWINLARFHPEKHEQFGRTA